MLGNEILRHPFDIGPNVLAIQSFDSCTQACNDFGPQHGETLGSCYLLMTEPQLFSVASQRQLRLDVADLRPLTLPTQELGNAHERVDSVQQPRQWSRFKSPRRIERADCVGPIDRNQIVKGVKLEVLYLMDESRCQPDPTRRLRKGNRSWCVT